VEIGLEKIAVLESTACIGCNVVYSALEVVLMRG
jgi:hypothetical protein